VGPVGVANQRVHQRLPRDPIGPVAGRLAGRPVVVVAPQQTPDLGGQLGGQARSSPRIAPRSMVTVSWVVTASSKGGESSTRRTPTRPAWRASTQVTRKIWYGSSERRSRARRSTSTVWAKLAVSPPGHPAAATPGRIPPAHIEGEPVGHLPIAQPFQALQHHDRRQDRPRHRAAPPAG
jgi:hypothetical protein